MFSCRSLSILLLAASASANVCVTESHNISFVDTNGDINASSSAVVNQCQQLSVTNNSECQSNLRCGELAMPYPSGQVECETNSGSLQFTQRGSALDVGSAANAALNECTSDSFTSNSDCQGNLSCHDGRRPDPSSFTCTTTSNNLQFTASGNDSGEAGTQAITQCQQNQYTNNSECTANVRCQPSGYNPPAPPRPLPPAPPVPVQGASSCTITTPYGNQYTGNGLSEAAAESEAHTICINSGYTPFDCTHFPISCQ